MEEQQQQIWQRVFARQEIPSGTELYALHREAAALAAIYRRIGETLSGKEAQLARKLAEGEQANAACLRGIGTLSGNAPEPVKLWEPAAKKAALESCYHRTRRCLVEYTARSADPDFGPAYHAMAQREEKHCEILLRLLGG